ALAGDDRDPETLARLRELYHLNDPIWMQYLQWVKNALQGDLGRSIRTGLPVSDMIAQKLPVTIQLAVMSMIFAAAIGIPAGIISAVKKGTITDYAANVIALSGLSIPNFWLGIMLILLVSVKWRLLPASGYVPLSEDPVQSIRTMLMPAFVLGTALAASLMRHTRSAMLGVLRQDYVRTARAKGVSHNSVLFKHAFRNAVNPLVTLFGYSLASLLSGSLLVEIVMNWPGLGRLVFEAISAKDEPLVLASVLISTLLLVFGNLVADLLLALVDPRVRLS
ncbi:MAG TPA: ABC transporter permease, partial [Planctomycetes bacterium]|nr:ABC transporter permease [Planctomycetota bacterium]